MNIATKLERKTLLSSIAAIALVSSGAMAQAQDQTQGQNQDQNQAQQQQTQSPSAEQGQATTTPGTTSEATSGEATGTTGDQAGAEGQQQNDALVATVGDREIRQSDVLALISGLPPQVRQAPPQMLVPAVVEQLVLQELILERARAENLQEDPEVVALVESDSAAAQDRALVKVWLERELEERVTDADVQAAYDEAKAANPEMTQTLEEATPQITQLLQRQAMEALSEELQEGSAIVFYDPSGQPIEAGDETATGSVGTGGSAGTGTNDASTEADTETGAANGSGENEGEQNTQ